MLTRSAERWTRRWGGGGSELEGESISRVPLGSRRKGASIIWFHPVDFFLEAGGADQNPKKNLRNNPELDLYTDICVIR